MQTAAGWRLRALLRRQAPDLSPHLPVDGGPLIF
jgi:hypothetical protein